MPDTEATQAVMVGDEGVVHVAFFGFHGESFTHWRAYCGDRVFETRPNVTTLTCPHCLAWQAQGVRG